MFLLNWGSYLYGQRLEVVDPSQVGLRSETLVRCESMIAEGIEQRKMPGCVICMGRHGKIAYLKAFGDKQLLPTQEAMEIDTVFDMASITKPVATATSIMILIERGALSLDDTVATHLPEFGLHGKEAITIRDLLVHQSGLTPDNAMADYLEGPEVAWEKICGLKLVSPVRSEFKYSDVNFIVLGVLVKRISGADLHSFSQEHLFRPLKMNETGFLPSDGLRQRAAPTEQRDGQWIQGVVHDPRAWKLDGIAGHAGLFSTAQDLAIYSEMMLQGFRDEPRSLASVLSSESIRTMTQGYQVSSGIRGLGWDKRTGYSSNRGEKFSDAAFGHGGFTGTVLWIDPQLDLFFIFLSNRVHPDGKGSVNPLAGRLATILAESVIDRPHSEAR